MHRRAKRLHRKLVQEYGKPVDNIEQKLARSIDVPKSLSKAMLESRGKEGLDELDIKILASAFMIGGVETVGPAMVCVSPNPHLTPPALIDRRDYSVVLRCTPSLSTHTGQGTVRARSRGREKSPTDAL
jgi:hypothetical protein